MLSGAFDLIYTLIKGLKHKLEFFKKAHLKWAFFYYPLISLTKVG
ncbi:hypothetical protein HBNCFIEN_03499 (plasmid) [Legionella sp. PC997]|nr:hypothetical protein HBNCFIEN_03499 [Legionella sp. PC997]